MLSINDLENGLLVLVEGEPFQILEVKHLHMGRGGSSVQTRLRSLKSGQVLSKNFKPADTFEEADVEKRPVTFIYRHRGEFVFSENANPKHRFSLKENDVQDAARWLTPNTGAEAIFWGEKLLRVTVPIKMDFTVIESPPGIKGDTAQGGTKSATIETGVKISVPLFVAAGDIIRVNTETGEYVERVKKGE